MNKFKPGDKVVCVRDSDDGSFFDHPGEIFTVSKYEIDKMGTKYETHSVWFKEMPAGETGVHPRRFELVITPLTNTSEPEVVDLDCLLKAANEGMKAEHLLLEKFFDKVERRHSKGDIWTAFSHNPYNGYSVYREKQKPTFEPFYIGEKTCCSYDPITRSGSGHTGPCTSGTLVELGDPTNKAGSLRIGSERYNPEEVKEILTALCKDKKAWYDAYMVTRDGIEHKNKNKLSGLKLSWADADKVLEALERVGVK